MNTVREIDLESLVLYRGGHADSENELALKMCVMEAVAFVAGEPWSDHPECACPVLGCFLRNWNDSLDDATRQRLKPYIPRLVGTKDGNSERRSWMCMDWLTRECGPAFMDLTPELRSHAAALRALPEITKVSLESAMVTLAAARDAAGAAAWAAAARDAAGAAAWAAAARAAAGAAAARDAAWAAAGAAAWDAGWAALKPTLLKLQESAFRLLDRMLDLPAQDAAEVLAVNEEFTCAACGGTFQKLWTDEEAASEREANFGAAPQTDDGMVCDDCYNSILAPSERPEEGTPEAIVEAMFELAERECGHNPVSAKHALPTIAEWIAEAKSEIATLRADKERLNWLELQQGNVVDAYTDNPKYGVNIRANIDAAREEADRQKSDDAARTQCDMLAELHGSGSQKLSTD